MSKFKGLLTEEQFNSLLETQEAKWSDGKHWWDEVAIVHVRLETYDPWADRLTARVITLRGENVQEAGLVIYNLEKEMSEINGRRKVDDQVSWEISSFYKLI